MQVVTDALVNPPRPGDPSYDLYHKEMTTIISSLRDKARLVHQRMNRIPGVQCNEIQGSMEAFPRLDIPHEAWDDARVRSSCTSMYNYYALALIVMGSKRRGHFVLFLNFQTRISQEQLLILALF